MTDAFIGIDVAFAKRKVLPVVICTWRDGRLVPEALRKLSLTPPRGSGNAALCDASCVAAFAHETAQYLARVCDLLALTPRCIAIDAPRGPRAVTQPRRAAEQAMDAARINCFTTPTAPQFDIILRKVRAYLVAGGAHNRIPHANQLWMLAGFELFNVLGRIAPCIEVYPQAIVRAIGAGRVHKFKAGGVQAQLAEAARHTGWPTAQPDETRFEDIAIAPSHDRLDAYLSAWVAALDEANRIAFGSPPHDVIWVPRITSASESVPLQDRTPPSIHVRSARAPAPRAPHTQSTGLTTGDSMDCPACGEHRFTRWPFGWDAHAAHRCGGLVATDPISRKAEFKRRFVHLFRKR